MLPLKMQDAGHMQYSCKPSCRANPPAASHLCLISVQVPYIHACMIHVHGYINMSPDLHIYIYGVYIHHISTPTSYCISILHVYMYIHMYVIRMHGLCKCG